ncbi:MAG: aromatic ring-hydroxylating oxygenase subunit alpha [bacterium]
MSTTLNAHREAIRRLAPHYRQGYGFPRAFYHDPELYDAEIDAIWRRGWLFAVHSCEVPGAGDYAVFDVDTDSIVIVRREDGTVGAMHNVCRHRGSLVVTQPCGRSRAFVCPYHQWTYGLDGRLLAARHMPAALDTSALGLKAVWTQEMEGLIFVSLADQRPDFDAAAALMAPMARPAGFRRARVAKALDYAIHANWKLLWENNRECYHCDASHPQYIKANFDRYESDDLDEHIARQIEEATSRSQAKWAACGLAVTHGQGGLPVFPDKEGRIWYSANRTALVDGYVTESLDGRRLAPLMGDYADEDVGTLRLRTLPNFWSHGSCDYAVTTRLVPAGPRLTRARTTWLVHESAQEGRDYDLTHLMPFWQLTSEQDWEICERQQRGVDSRAYEPGPLSKAKEYNVESLHRWYFNSMADGVPAPDAT